MDGRFPAGRLADGLLSRNLYRSWPVTTPGGGGGGDVLLPGDMLSKVSSRTVRVATEGFVSDEADEPPLEHIPPGLMPLTVSRQLPLADGMYGGIARTSVGEIAIDNTDGRWTKLAMKSVIDGRQVAIRVGRIVYDEHGRRKSIPLRDYGLVMKITGRQITMGERMVRISTSDFVDLLQQPLQMNRYSGTGGKNGSVALKNRTKPIALGRLFNIPAIMVDEARLIMDVSDGAIFSVDAVRVRGVPLKLQARTYSWAEFTGTQIEPGKYVVLAREAKIRLATNPDGEVTVDVHGEGVNASKLKGIPWANGRYWANGLGWATDSSNAYGENIASLLVHILVRRAGIPDHLLDAGSFRQLAAKQPAVLGYYLPSGSNETVEQALSRILASVGAVGFQNRAGRFVVRRLEAPLAVPAATFTRADIVEVRVINSPFSPGWYRHEMIWRRNWTMQNSDALAGSVSAADRDTYSSEGQKAVAQNGRVRAYRPSAGVQSSRRTYFWAEEDAAAEAIRLLALYNGAVGDAKRPLFEVEIRRIVPHVDLADTVRIVDDRYGLADGLNLVVVGMEESSNRRTILTCYG